MILPFILGLIGGAAAGVAVMALIDNDLEGMQE